MNRKVTALIVDDEPLARRTIRSLLSSFEDVEVAGECSHGAEAVESIRQNSPDIVFLDIQMPGMNGFEVLQHLDSDALPVVIFVTAYDQYALKAFEIHALDYLLKPFNDERFEASVQRALSHVHSDRQTLLSRKLLNLLGDNRIESLDTKAADQRGVDRIAIKSQGRIAFVAVQEIDWIEAADQYVMIHVNRQSHLVRESMNQLEEKLPSDTFFRIHRSSLVNLHRIREIRSSKQGESQIVLNDGTSLKVSRTRRAPLQEALAAGRP